MVFSLIALALSVVCLVWLGYLHVHVNDKFRPLSFNLKCLDNRLAKQEVANVFEDTTYTDWLFGKVEHTEEFLLKVMNHPELRKSDLLRLDNDIIALRDKNIKQREEK